MRIDEILLVVFTPRMLGIVNTIIRAIDKITRKHCDKNGKKKEIKYAEKPRETADMETTLSKYLIHPTRKPRNLPKAIFV
jgi:predicted helicase